MIKIKTIFLVQCWLLTNFDDFPYQPQMKWNSRANNLESRAFYHYLYYLWKNKIRYERYWANIHCNGKWHEIVNRDMWEINGKYIKLRNTVKPRLKAIMRSRILLVQWNTRKRNNIPRCLSPIWFKFQYIVMQLNLRCLCFITACF